MNKSTETENLEEIDISDIFNYDKKLVVFNDDHNPIEYVVRLFVAVLKHSASQAEQCTMLIHHTGKCAVKEGSEEKLMPFKQALLDGGLKVEIQ